MSSQGNYPATLLLNALSDGLSLPDILTIASGIIGNPVLFDDVTDQICATSDGMDLEQFYRRPIQIQQSGEARFVPPDMVARGRKDGITDRARSTTEALKTYDPVFDCAWIFAYVVVNGAIVGDLVTRSMNRDLTEEDRQVMNTLSWVVSLFLQCQTEGETLPRAEMYFLYNLLKHNQVSEHNLPKWLENMAWRPGEEMRLAVFRGRLDREDIEWSYYISVLKQYHPDSILCTYENGVVLLESHGEVLSDEEERSTFSYVLYSSDLVAGYSRSFSSLNDVPKAYRQACNAIRLGLKQGVAEQALFFYEDHVLDQMVEACSQDEETLLSLCHPAIFRLIRYDREHGTEFYRTLETFFRLGNNLARLSEEMGIHRNTAYYRMSKIYQITQVDLRGDPSILRLQFSFELLRGRDLSNSELFT